MPIGVQYVGIEWAEENLAKIPPKFALKHFSEVLAVVRWLEFDMKRSDFTRLELETSIHRWPRQLEMGHPYHRLKARALKVMDEVVDGLLSAGLLVEKDGLLHKGENFEMFIRLLRWLQSGVERRVCWVLIHLHAKGVKSFTIEEVLDFLLYPEVDYRKELPELTFWKNGASGRWVKLLAKKGDKWAIVEKNPSPRRPILILDLASRLRASVSMLAKSKNTFVTSEALALLRSLEEKSVNRTLKRIGLEHFEKRWILDSNLVHKSGGLLDRLELKKVLKVKRIIVNPHGRRFVRVESRDIVERDPVRLLQLMLHEVFSLDKSAKDAKDFQRGCREILGRWNEKLYPFGIELKLRRASPFGYPPNVERFAIRMKRHPREKFEGNLMEVYSKIQVCRMPESKGTSIWSKISTYSKPDDLLRYLGDKRKEFNKKLENSYNQILLFLNWWKKELGELIRRDPVNMDSFLYSAGFGEITNTLMAAFLSAHNGFFRSAFKDLRETIEWLALTTFLDSLKIRYVYPGHKLPRQLYHEAIENGDWHRVLEGRTDIAGLIKNIPEVKRGVTVRLYEPNKDLIDSYGMSEECFVDEVIRHMSLPLFIAATGDILCPDHAIKKKYCVPYKEIGPYIGFEFVRILAMKKEGKDFQPWLRPEDGKRLLETFGKLDLEIPTNCTFRFHSSEAVCGKDADLNSQFAIRVPTTNVLLYLAGKRLNLPRALVKEMMSRYNEYCCLVHPYPQTMQYSPFTAGDEVDLWVSELERLLLLLNEAFCRLFVFTRSGFDEKSVGKRSKVCGKCKFAESRFMGLNRKVINQKRWLK